MFSENEVGEVVCSKCEGVLRCNVGFPINSAHKLVWWRCTDCGAMTEAVPLPPGVNNLTLPALLGVLHSEHGQTT